LLPTTPFCVRRFANRFGTLQILSKIAAMLVIDFELRDCIVNFRKPCNINWAPSVAVSIVAPVRKRAIKISFFLV
jgi:hypothetical protein